MKKKCILGIFLGVILDQISKAFMKCLLNSSSLIVIPHFFKLELAYNTGGAWSILNDNISILIVLNLVILIFLFKMYAKIKETPLMNISYVLLISGTLGNLIDRLVYHKVCDFLSFNLFGYSYPIFNLADVFIVMGAILLMIVLEREDKNARIDKSKK